MDDILKKLYMGQLFPAEMIRLDSEEYQEIKEMQGRDYDAFLKKLSECSPECAGLFREMEKKEDTVPYEMAEAFKLGFSIGAKIVMEVYENTSV